MISENPVVVGILIIIEIIPCLDVGYIISITICMCMIVCASSIGIITGSSIRMIIS
jgi:hypothetical protein